MLVICDRYSQVKVFGYNDGPLPSVWLNSTSGFRRALFERRIYERAAGFPPDLVIKLNVPPKAAAIRQPEGDRRFRSCRGGLAVGQIGGLPLVTDSHVARAKRDLGARHPANQDQQREAENPARQK